MRQRHVTHCLLAFALVTLAAARHRGPPLVCHPYDIGTQPRCRGTPGELLEGHARQLPDRTS